MGGGTVRRKNVRNLSVEERDDLVRAWAGIQKLSPDDPNSFFMIAGYHGEPFRGAGYSNSQWWGGWCNHGNVLFPTWHRAYLASLEAALQTIVPGVALAYWDEIEEDSLKQGIPDIFLQREYVYADGTKIPNPLYSYKFQAGITDRLTSDAPGTKDPSSYNYSKHEGYETVRYPFSGIVGTPKDAAVTAQHNADLRAKGDVVCNEMLNENIVTWLNLPLFKNDQCEDVTAGIRDNYLACMNAPNYTCFSNGTSAQKWNDDHRNKTGYTTVVALEHPHDSMHLAVGGFEIKTQEGTQSYDVYPGANGDMGENDTASFDPIFYFHHCWIDLVFSLWQAKNGGTDSLEIIEHYPGTNSVDSQGPTPGVAGGTWLTLDSPLAPFKKLGSQTEMLTSRDVADIRDLGYEYEYSGELKPADPEPGKYYAPAPAPFQEPAPVLSIGNISRARIGGSFVVTAWATPKDGSGGRVLVGTKAVLSRLHVSGCANCQNHLDVRAHVPLHGFTKQQAQAHDYTVELCMRGDGKSAGGGHAGYGAPLQPKQPKPTFKLHFGHLGNDEQD
ncbi:hypothetical protein Micbo1qcDRAFT_219907 [Microdochium bolleyi]|uniref:tyrosinase n=1 Tax=Microdochium bolleyi TaxID=196109 RepID=A0A136IM69_9PEZI|nr:hypothetical protein Micbo1qcDRAFT_219907 [Microdochium bolleyi]